MVYQAPFLRTEKDRQVGISHLLYVKLKDESGKTKLEELAKEHKVKILGNNKLMPLWYTLSCNAESSGHALQVANKLFESGNFTAAEPDFLTDFNLVKCANDTHFKTQWGMKNTGQGSGTSGIDIGICEAWNKTLGNDDIVVAVLDHGIELDHPDMPNVSTSSFDTTNGSSPSIVRGSHGTACAGIVGAIRNDAGVSGVAPEITLMSISDNLTLGPGAQARMATGLSWAWKNGAHVISNSWGHDLLASHLIDDAIEDALDKGRSGLGCVVVFAAGNNDGPVIYPGNSNPRVLTVGAMSPCGERKNPGSCDGETWWGSCYGSELDVVAPGVLLSLIHI